MRQSLEVVSKPVFREGEAPAEPLLTLLSATSAKKIPVVAIDDAQIEDDETLFVTLSNPTGGATLGDDVGTATILDDDQGE